jgi:hypothetical protein
MNYGDYITNFKVLKVEKDPEGNEVLKVDDSKE